MHAAVGLIPHGHAPLGWRREAAGGGRILRTTQEETLSFRVKAPCVFVCVCVSACLCVCVCAHFIMFRWRYHTDMPLLRRVGVGHAHVLGGTKEIHKRDREGRGGKEEAGAHDESDQDTSDVSHAFHSLPPPPSSALSLPPLPRSYLSSLFSLSLSLSSLSLLSLSLSSLSFSLSLSLSLSLSFSLKWTPSERG